MPRLFVNPLPSGLGRLRRPGLPELVCAALALACLVLPEWWTVSRNLAERKTELREMLSVRLEGAEEALESWSARLRDQIAALAARPEVESVVRLQAALAGPPDTLRSSIHLAQLRQILNDSRQLAGRYSGRIDDFLVVTRSGRVIAASASSWVGREVPLPPGSALRTALEGEAALTRLGGPDLNLVLERPELETSILAAAPVRGAEGRVLAALAIRVEPLSTLRSLIAARNGQGEGVLYAYTAGGNWLAGSDGGNVGDTSEQPAAGVDVILARIASGDAGAPVAAVDPMHERAVFNVDGYQGRAGQPVVGASGAVPDIGIGLVAELDLGKAYRSVHQTRWTLIGLALVLGLALLFMVLNQTSGGAGRTAPVPASAKNTAAWAILAVSVAATGITWWAARARVDEYDRSRFEQEAKRIRDDLLKRVDHYAETLRSVRASFEAFGDIQPQEWNEFVGSLELPETFPSFGYVAFVENVPQSNLKAFEEALNTQPGDPYQVHPLGTRPFYYPIRYVAPEAPNRGRRGFDLGSSGMLRPTLEQARDSGEVTVSSVVPDAVLAGGETGVLMVDPVYRGGSDPLTRLQRRAAIAGWVVAFVRTSVMIERLSASSIADIDFEVFDGNKRNRELLIYDHDGVPQNETERDTSRFHEALLADVGGRTWTLYFSSASGFDLPITQNHPAQVLVGGLAISVLLFDIALVLSSTRSRALAIAELMTRKVRESEARVRAVIDNALDGIITFDEAGRIETFNPGAERLFGHTAAEAQGLRVEELIPSYQRMGEDDQSGTGTSPWFRHIMHGSGRECTACRRDQTTFPAELTISRIQSPDRILYTAIVRDISQRKAAEEKLRESEARYALAARAANDGLWDWNLRTDSIYYSPRWKSMLGIEESAVIDTPEVWFHRVHPDDRARLQADLDTHLDGHSSQFESEYRMMHRDGSYRWMLSRAIVVRDESGRPVRIAGSQTDVTGRKQAERQLLYDALHDPLTGLPNRSYFMGQLDRATKEAARQEGRMFGILFLDIDRFKLVNDSLGHMVGDQLLVAIAGRLKLCLRPGDTIARLGGDEFAILVENLTDVKDATHIAERIQSELALPFRAADQEVFTSASIGITLNSSARGSSEDLLRNADTAMYRAKAQGRARYELFDQVMHTRAVEFLRMESALRRALERDEFLVHYQPIVSLESGAISRVEALIRWQHPERGLVAPGEFVPLAEETGLIISITAWLLRKTCAQVKVWQEAGLPNIRLAVNISPRQLKQEDLFETVSQALFEANLSPEYLDLELTESALMESTEDTIRPLVELHAKGVQVSLDDFGTGYSSLMYLRRFPISNLKIDASFVHGITTDPGDAAIASGLIALAHSLDLRVTAEGVETPEQLEYLRHRHCDEVQGHFISPPLDAAACTELLRRGVDSSLFSWIPGGRV